MRWQEVEETEQEEDGRLGAARGWRSNKRGRRGSMDGERGLSVFCLRQFDVEIALVRSFVLSPSSPTSLSLSLSLILSARISSPPYLPYRIHG